MKWNDEVDMIIGHLDKVSAWLDAPIRNADLDKDWHTSRNSTRAKHYIELARIEMYDMQYEDDAHAKKVWGKRINKD